MKEPYYNRGPSPALTTAINF